MREKTKVSAAQGLRLIFGLGALSVAFQAFRFVHGNVGAPFIDQLLIALDPAGVEDAVSTCWWAPVSRWLYLAVGVYVWLLAAWFVSAAGQTLARAVEVGLANFLTECRAAAAESRLAHQAENDRAAPRRSRQRLLDAQKPKPVFSLTTLAIGVVVGLLL